MKQQHRSLVSALMLAGLFTPAMLLTGCLGGNDGSAAVTQGAPVAKASVGISVQFPDAGASAAFIDGNATALRVEIWDATARQCHGSGESEYCYFTGEPTHTVELQRPSGGGDVTARLQDVSVGEARVVVTQLADGRVLERVNVAAHLVEGNNPMTVTLVRAAWLLRTPVTFNKLVTDDTTRIDSFSLVPLTGYDEYGGLVRAGKASTDAGSWFPAMITPYGAVVKGGNLCRYDDYGGYGGQVDSFTCGLDQLVSAGGYHYEGGVIYFNRHDSRRPADGFALLGAFSDQPLANDPQGRERGWFAFSAMDGRLLDVVDEHQMTVSDPNLWLDMRIAPTSGNTLAGNLFEWRQISYAESNRRCYSLTWNSTNSNFVRADIDCPALAGSAKAKAGRHGAPFRVALTQRVAQASAGAGKAAADAQGCYRNLSIEYPDTEFGGYLSYEPYSYWEISYDVEERVDACRHEFIADARQLPDTDVALVRPTGMQDTRAGVKRR